MFEDVGCKHFVSTRGFRHSGSSGGLTHCCLATFNCTALRCLCVHRYCKRTLSWVHRQWARYVAVDCCCQLLLHCILNTASSSHNTLMFIWVSNTSLSINRHTAQLSAQRAALTVRAAKKNSEATAAFIEEAVVRRELSGVQRLPIDCDYCTDYKVASLALLAHAVTCIQYICCYMCSLESWCW